VLQHRFRQKRSDLGASERPATAQESSGRFWKMINPVDLGVIVLLVVAVWRLFTVYLPPARPTRTVEVTLEMLIRNIPAYVSQSIAPGQDLFQDRTESYLGKICSRTVQPAERLVNRNGQLVLAADPRNLDLYIKLRRSGQMVTDSPRRGIYLGKLAVRIGERLKMHTLYAAVTGEVIALRLRQEVARHDE
jgi:hypothetical protein